MSGKMSWWRWHFSGIRTVWLPHLDDAHHHHTPTEEQNPEDVLGEGRHERELQRHAVRQRAWMTSVNLTFICAKKCDWFNCSLAESYSLCMAERLSASCRPEIEPKAELHIWKTETCSEKTSFIHKWKIISKDSFLSAVWDICPTCTDLCGTYCTSEFMCRSPNPTLSLSLAFVLLAEIGF